MITLLFGLACFDSSDALEARVAELEAQHAADLARIEALEQRLDSLQPVLDRLGQTSLFLGEESGLVPTSIEPTDVHCERDGEVYIFPPMELLNTDEVSRAARVVPHRAADGEIDGYRVSGIRSGSLGHTCGLKNGDIVTAVDRMPLHTPSLALEAWERIGAQGDFTVSVTRRGAPVEVRMRRPE